jgi:hypothetical protein
MNKRLERKYPMTIPKTSRSIPGLAFIGMLIVALVGIAGLAVLVDELAESSWTVPTFIQTYFSYREAWRESTGNEFTGEATAWLFGASSLPVGVDLISKTAIRYLPLGDRVTAFIRRINNTQRKYLLPLHTWLSVLALGLGLLHLILSTCAANPLPELGLILCGLLVATGLLFKWKAIPATLRKTLYQFHASLIVTGALLLILFTGHAVMDLD